MVEWGLYILNHALCYLFSASQQLNVDLQARRREEAQNWSPQSASASPASCRAQYSIEGNFFVGFFCLDICDPIFGYQYHTFLYVFLASLLLYACLFDDFSTSCCSFSSSSSSSSAFRHLLCFFACLLFCLFVYVLFLLLAFSSLLFAVLCFCFFLCKVKKQRKYPGSKEPSEEASKGARKQGSKASSKEGGREEGRKAPTPPKTRSQSKPEAFFHGSGKHRYRHSHGCTQAQLALL